MEKVGRLMSTAALNCDQAIFTSIRTPMGEGYRIIAASRGVRPEEKQLITRRSPSHGALCEVTGGAEKALAAAGYAAITTEIVDRPTFYFAEDYHQQYLAKNPNGYCGLGGTGVACPVATGVA